MFKKFKDKLKGDDHNESHQKQEKQPQDASHQQSNLQSNNPFHPNNYTAPPPWQNQSGSHNITPNEKFQPPPGAPPGYAGASSSSGYEPPPGPPPSKDMPQQPPPSWEPPPYHDWTVIPDTALLPPPPSIGYDTSPTANATEEDGGLAYEWCIANPLWPPQNLTPPTHGAIQNGQLALLTPPTFTGNVFPMQQAGHWKCHTQARCRDSALLTNLPMYSVFWDSPLNTHRPKTVYFELKVLGIGSGGYSLSEADAGIAIGFIAPPYPTFRLPGWQRGSLGVHGDDGRKYVNDTFGGVDFTTAFQPGETVGIGMTFALPREPPSYEQSQMGKVMDIDVFFTRNGQREKAWDGNDELDERSEGGTMGLRGECDLFPAVGVFGGVDFEVFFHPSQWMYRPI
ncbi:uncharacterized protein CC84DRAFT_1168063 [Paraphaeosphaeria sporulosa]|uniref:SPRY domain-containing protein n=1 Tax=Paraphaeosphaeria sporulosa TaxID=1460663 RepID=A0A177BZ77_9PLEO|nr:uncharacterized protein CC84DRAFT_1168063 [Paraphaeosphaeria sporulosa]OAG00834.1 hypothetical protein CC84DRAFT_1168063 [Paraphaeosphaeria sporulosa]